MENKRRKLMKKFTLTSVEFNQFRFVQLTIITSTSVGNPVKHLALKPYLVPLSCYTVCNLFGQFFIKISTKMCSGATRIFVRGG